MPLQTSGKISHADIMAEFGIPANTTFSLSDDGGPLISYPSGQPKVFESDFYGAAAPSPGAYVVNAIGHRAGPSLGTGGGTTSTTFTGLNVTAGDLVIYFWGDEGYHNKSFAAQNGNLQAIHAKSVGRERFRTASNIDYMSSNTTFYRALSDMTSITFLITSNQYCKTTREGLCVISGGTNWGVDFKKSYSTTEQTSNVTHATNPPSGKNYIFCCGGSWYTSGGGNYGASSWTLGRGAAGILTENYAGMDTNGNVSATRDTVGSTTLWRPTLFTNRAKTQGGVITFELPATANANAVLQTMIGATNPTAYASLLSYDPA